MPSDEDFVQPLDHQFRRSVSRRLIDSVALTPVDQREDETYSYEPRPKPIRPGGDKPASAGPEDKKWREECEKRRREARDSEVL